MTARRTPPKTATAKPKRPRPSKRTRFVKEYLKHHNGARAARDSGYSKKNARNIASEILAIPNIQQAVAEGTALQLQRAELSALRVLEELRRLAFMDPADFFDADGSLKAIGDIPADARACIAGLEVARANFDPTDGKRSKEWLHKIKLSSKTAALELLARHFALLHDHVKVDIGVSSALLERLDRGRARLAAADPLEQAKMAGSGSTAIDPEKTAR